MPQTIEHYTPQLNAAKIKTTAIAAWSFGLALALGWIFLILGAPLAEAAGGTGLSAPIYNFFSYLCHQIPSRTFHFDDHALAVCSRCFGVYFGLLSGFLIYPFLRPLSETEPLSRFWLFAAMIPIGIDWSLGFFDIRENTSASRFVTGAILGAACGFFIVPALVEIFGLVAGKTRRERAGEKAGDKR